MATHARPGVVIFTANVPRLTTFYKALTGLPMRHADSDHAVLSSESFELVIHALRHEPADAVVADFELFGPAMGRLPQAVLSGGFAGGGERAGRATRRKAASAGRGVGGPRLPRL